MFFPEEIMSHIERRKFIIRLVDSNRISTQGELIRQLQENGFEVTQATVSRDIAAIGLVKAAGVYVSPEDRQSPTVIKELIQNRILLLHEAGPNMAVLKTGTGEASAVGLAIDRAEWPFVAGTIAGDDTVFVAFADQSGQKDFIEIIRQISPSALMNP